MKKVRWKYLHDTDWKDGTLEDIPKKIKIPWQILEVRLPCSHEKTYIDEDGCKVCKRCWDTIEVIG